MALKEILKNNITSYKPLEEIYNLARQEKYYKIATIERELRRLTNNGIIEPVMKKTILWGIYRKTKKNRSECKIWRLRSFHIKSSTTF